MRHVCFPPCGPSRHREGSVSAQRIAHKLRGAAAAIKREPFFFKRSPRHDSFMRWLGRWPDDPSRSAGWRMRAAVRVA